MRIKLGYRYKLLLSFWGVFAIFTVVLVLFQSHYERQLRRDNFRDRMNDYADMVARDIHADGDSVSVSSLRSFRRRLPREVRFTVISRTGQVLFESSRDNPALMDNHANRPEVEGALRSPSGSYDIRHSSTLAAPYFYFAKAYGSYVVRVARPYDASVKSLLHTTNVFLIFVLFVLPIVTVILIHVSDGFGRAVQRLRQFAAEADRGTIKYSEIKFPPDSELGDIGREILRLYREIEEKSELAKADRDKLIKHFRYFDGGIAVFEASKGVVYANPRFVQYVNTILPVPTGDVNTLWGNEAFRPAREFVELNSHNLIVGEEAPVMRFNVAAGSTTYSVQVVVYSLTDFEMTIVDATRAEKNRVLKQQMSNNITHELRTPVSSIRGYIETILECPGLPEERKKYFLERAYAQVMRLNDLIRDVAMITKTDEAPETLKKETLRPHAILDEVAEELAGKISEHHISLTNAIAPEVEAYGNYSLVYSIFRNLVENSIRYAGDGVEVYAECYSRDRDFCYFNFYDTGCGCPEEHLPRLFERFYRAEEGRTREVGGTGLGLSIVRNAVAFHHGNISVRNRPGGGLQFLFTLQAGSDALVAGSSA